MKTTTVSGTRVVVDWTACDGRGLCTELLPELISRDEWGFPLIADSTVPTLLRDHAERAVAACPRLALRLSNT
jgi:ferredoxin